MKKFLAIFCLVLILISCNIYSCKADLPDDYIEVAFEPSWANGVSNNNTISEIMASSNLRAFVSAALYYDLFTSDNKNIPISSDDSSELLLNSSYVYNNMENGFITIFSNDDYLVYIFFSPGSSTAFSYFVKNTFSHSIETLVEDSEDFYLNDKADILDFMQQVKKIFSELLN